MHPCSDLVAVGTVFVLFEEVDEVRRFGAVHEALVGQLLFRLSLHVFPVEIAPAASRHQQEKHNPPASSASFLLALGTHRFLRLSGFSRDEESVRMLRFFQVLRGLCSFWSRRLFRSFHLFWHQESCAAVGTLFVVHQHNVPAAWAALQVVLYGRTAVGARRCFRGHIVTTFGALDEAHVSFSLFYFIRSLFGR